MNKKPKTQMYTKQFLPNQYVVVSLPEYESDEYLIFFVESGVVQKDLGRSQKLNQATLIGYDALYTLLTDNPDERKGNLFFYDPVNDVYYKDDF